MRLIFLVPVATLAAGAALAFTPATERDFGEFAASGCNNRDGDFLIRGMVSSANEDTLVLSDPDNSRTTMSITLPGRGPLARVRGVFGESKHEASDERLNQLRSTRTPVLATLKCKGDGTPVARELAYQNADGSHSAISF